MCIFTTLSFLCACVLFLVTRWEIKELTFISGDQTSSQSSTSLLLWSVELHSYAFYLHLHSLIFMGEHIHRWYISRCLSLFNNCIVCNVLCLADVSEAWLLFWLCCERQRLLFFSFLSLRSLFNSLSYKLESKQKK